jgi:hypothetical protein
MSHQSCYNGYVGSQKNSVEPQGPLSKTYLVGKGRKVDKLNCVFGLTEETPCPNTKIPGHHDPK